MSPLPTSSPSSPPGLGRAHFNTKLIDFVCLSGSFFYTYADITYVNVINVYVTYASDTHVKHIIIFLI